MNKFNLIEAKQNDYAIIDNLWHYYVYDLSRYCSSLEGWELPTELSFKTDDLPDYFSMPNSHLLLIKINNDNAGFVFLRKLPVMPEVDWLMSDFFIISKYQGCGIGKAIANETFRRFPGKWAVGVLPVHTAGLNFWRKVIQSFTQGNFIEEYKTSDELKSEGQVNPYPMNMLLFETKYLL